ncbi:MAG: type II toxin-antitoxin system RelE/ParE family toxin [Gammaproteobacteria bacterium]|nr:type II toxin-antitoxin system RelE/ParE family toxin [Gammaproteobacteria bacterium]
MSYDLSFKRQAMKALVRLPREEGEHVLERLQKLAENPGCPDVDVKALQGRPGYRLRIGGMRIVFERDDKRQHITILRIAPRGRAYRQ